MNVLDSEIKILLEQYKSLTVYGLSPDTEKASHRIPKFMSSHGYDIVGLYPRHNQIAQWPIYPKLSDVPLPHRKFVDVFRRSENIPEVVDEVLAAGGVEVLWLQLGISHPQAEKRAEEAGLKVVSNRCLLVEYQRFFS